MSSSALMTNQTLGASTSTVENQRQRKNVKRCYESGCCSSCCGIGRRKSVSDDSNSVIRKRDSVHSENSMQKNLPYCGKLPENLALVEGQAIFVEGSILENCTRFAINLVCARNEKTPNVESNVAFHFNPRLDQRYVVRNCKVNGIWGDEETSSSAKFPFRTETQYHVCIFMGRGEFLVAVNGAHFCGFAYRMPLANVDSLEVVGKVEVKKVEYKVLDRYPELTENNWAVRIPNHDEDGIKEEMLQLPFTGFLPHGFSIGNEIEIHGRVKVLPHSFYLNLQKGSQIWPHPQIPLHLNPRFKTSVGEHCVIRNAWINGSWGKEERLPGNNFHPGEKFLLMIRKEMDKYTIWLDSKLCGEFPFRSNTEEVDAVHVQGDVVINRIFYRATRKY